MSRFRGGIGFPGSKESRTGRRPDPKFNEMRMRVLCRPAAFAASVALAAIVVPAAHADPSIPPLPTGSPTPSSQPTSGPRPRPSPRPSSTPQSERPRPPRGPAPTPYDGPAQRAIDQWRTAPKSPSRTTTALLELLQRLQPPGIPLDQAAVIAGIGRFPVAGYVWYQDDWGAPRWEPYFHTHEGNDLFAVDGTPVVACADGVIDKLMVGTIGGVSIWLRSDDGTVYYYGHLRAYAPGVRPGLRVRLGQPIATVGDTGIAVGTYPHLHFEIHPGGGLPVNPKSTLDSWLFQSEARAVRAIKANVSMLASARMGAARWRTLLGLLAEPVPESAPLWTAALAPAGAPGLFAMHALDRIALETDWTLRSMPSPPPAAGRLSPIVQGGGVLSARSL